jgi:hypothetical protein
MTRAVLLVTGEALQSISQAWGDLGERVLAAPAGVLGTVSGTVATLPRLLLGDAVAAYQAASQALASLDATGACLL